MAHSKIGLYGDSFVEVWPEEKKKYKEEEHYYYFNNILIDS